MNRCVLIGGGSGLIGTRLTEVLLQKGYDVRHLGRKPREGKVKTFAWDIDKPTIDKRAFDGVDVVINLAGANISDHRWTESFKKELLLSRTGSTQLIVDNLKGRDDVQFIAGSAIGYYGFGESNQWFRETDPPGNDFMAQLTVQWENVSKQLKNVAYIRTGIVVSKKGGAIEEMAKPIKMYAGAPLGSGKQVVSWIHIEDHCGIVLHIIENKLTGAYNLTAPVPASNDEITKELAAKLHKPLLLPNIPPFALKLVLGEMSESVLNGSKVSSEKIQSTGYRFKYQTIHEALQQL